MKTKVCFIFFATVILALFFLTGEKALMADDSRDSLKRNLKHISCGCENDKSNMTAGWTVIEGNVRSGSYSWYSSSDGKKAERRAKSKCENDFGSCERLYSIFIFNDTSESITIYLFQPSESNFQNNNALFQWVWNPGFGSILGLSDENCSLLVHKGFYLKIESASGKIHWGPMSIGSFNTQLNNYSDGQNLRIRLTP